MRGVMLLFWGRIVLSVIIRWENRFFFGEEIFAVIVPEREAWTAGGIFLRIDGYSMMLMMLEITMQGLFYGTGRTIPPAVISITFNLARLPLSAALPPLPSA